MPTQVTFHTEASRDAFKVLRDELNALLAGYELAPPAPGAGPPASFTDADVREIVKGLSGIHPSLRNFMHFIARNYPETEFVWDDVARDMRLELGTVKSWHRSLSKQLNRTKREYPTAPNFFSRQRWDGSRNHYTVDAQWREAILGEW